MEIVSQESKGEKQAAAQNEKPTLWEMVKARSLEEILAGWAAPAHDIREDMPNRLVSNRDMIDGVADNMEQFMEEMRAKELHLRYSSYSHRTSLSIMTIMRSFTLYLE